MAQRREKTEVAPFSRERVPLMFDEMERFLSRFLGKGVRGFGPHWWPDISLPEMMGASYPVTDVYEDATSIVLKAEIPGVRKEDLSVDISENRISISGERKMEEKVSERDFFRVERSRGSFSRTFTLPTGVQSAKARATFRDGVLEIKIPKIKAEKKKEVKINIE